MASPITRIVSFCSDHHRLVIMLAIVFCGGAFVYAASHLAIDTDATKLIAEDVAWRKQERVFDAAFPHRADLIAIVVDAATPEAAEQAAAALTTRLSNQPQRFRSVWRPDGGAFFDGAGLLFQPTTTVAQTTQALIAAQPLLGMLAEDPSLRGLMDALAQVTQGAQPEQAVDKLEQPLLRLADVFENVAADKATAFSWRELLTGRAADPRELRRFILVQPVLDYGAIQPGADAVDAIRQSVHELGFGNEAGLRVRLTGPVPLADEEFATLSEGAGLNAAAMLLAVVVLLWAALQSWRLIAAIMLSLAGGLTVTTAFGLFVFGSFNLISVAFAVLFVGLGVDFGIQLCVCYRAKRRAGADLRIALRDAAAEVGGALALAAIAIAAGFYAFLPTEYRGVSELGVIAGTGMIVAFVGTITVLPALIVLFRPIGERAAVGFAALGGLDRLLARYYRLVLVFAAAIAIVSVAMLPKLPFDFNPLHLKSAGTESVFTLLDLMQDPSTTPNTIDVLAPSVADAAQLARRLAQLPEVDHTITLTSFVPDDQDDKLVLIQDAALLLDPVLNPARVKSPPDDTDTVRSMLRAAQSLGDLATLHHGTALSVAATRLERALRTAAQGEPELRERVRATLIPGLVTTLQGLDAALQARPVTLDTLPDELKRDWVAADGRARIEVFPRGDGNDNAMLQRFVAAVRQLAPEATGAPVSIQESTGTILGAFVRAGSWALLVIVALLAAALRRASDVLITLASLLLSGLISLGICAATGFALNFENIIALPLLFGIGVAFNIYYVMAWRAGRRDLLQSSLTRAVVFSALTTGTAFGSLWLSRHPGTSSMGELLALSLACTLVCALLFLPALLRVSGRYR
jgi:hopanoid biosynthesis associated RND transporter like protein HpnN